jgi:hypothetical protein
MEVYMAHKNDPVWRNGNKWLEIRRDYNRKLTEESYFYALVAFGSMFVALFIIGVYLFAH